MSMTTCRVYARAMKIKESIFILQSPVEIWKFWLPVSTDVQWRGGITKAEMTSQPPHGVGSTGIHYSKDLGPLPWTIIRWENGRHMEWVFGECKVMKGAIGYYHVDPESNGSRVSMESTMVPPFFMRIIMFFMSGKIRKGMKGDLQRLKAVMENDSSQ
jgi:hypothetical protein